MIKTFIDKIRDVENCIELDVLAGDKIYSLHIDESEDKKERLEELFNQIDTADEIEITISLFEDDKERVCTIIIFPEEEMFALLHKDLTEKMLKKAYKDGLLTDEQKEKVEGFGFISELDKLDIEQKELQAKLQEIEKLKEQIIAKSKNKSKNSLGGLDE